MRLRESHEKIMPRFKYKYEIVPAGMCSGGLISVVPDHLDYVVIGKSNSSQSLTIKKECSEKTVINVYVNPKDNFAQDLIFSIEELELNGTQPNLSRRSEWGH